MSQWSSGVNLEMDPTNVDFVELEAITKSGRDRGVQWRREHVMVEEADEEFI